MRKLSFSETKYSTITTTRREGVGVQEKIKMAAANWKRKYQKRGRALDCEERMHESRACLPSHLVQTTQVPAHAHTRACLALHDTPRVCADSHLENQVNPAVPALVNRWAESWQSSAIVGRWRDEEDVVLPRIQSRYYPIHARYY